MTIHQPNPDQSMEEAAALAADRNAFTQALQAGVKFADDELLEHGAHAMDIMTPSAWGVAITHVTDASKLPEAQGSAGDLPDGTTPFEVDPDVNTTQALATIAEFRQLSMGAVHALVCEALETQGLFLAPEPTVKEIAPDGERGFVLPPDGLTIRNVAALAEQANAALNI